MFMDRHGWGFVFGLVVAARPLPLWIADQVRNDGPVLVWICCLPVLWILP